ncbi:hypothetical protein NQ318_005902 [Aromia moschata]|uniref:Elongation of very long chain fatty acids protein n=1 Tax=Aromia moschata TaxID=1265417 RepID=A0AAV8YS66_9CUCU|nr:hypothetical protein NQ318_005902 [Aromia moschata]
MVKMSSLVHLMVENYNDFLEIKKDPTVDSWLLMKSPIPVVILLVFYLYFVLKLGPRFMEKREPFNLKHVLIGYNAYQVLFSLWLCSNIFHVKDAIELMTSSCKDVRKTSEHQYYLSLYAWWFIFSKIVELLDTVFFVLRKKQSQVTFLHVYHHSIMVLFSWVYLKVLPGEQGAFIGFLNTFVHVIMYSYYLIAALGPQYQKYLWWKKYMTTIQLAQFCIMLVYLLTITAMDCKIPKSVTFFFFGNIVIFLYLFADFYRKAYKTPKASRKSGVANMVKSQ